MGVLADSFRARLEEMRARHAVTDRELAEAREAVYASIAEIDRINKEIQEL